MARSLVSSLIFLLAVSASAAEHFLPIAPSTRVRLTNSGSETAIVSIECGSSSQILVPHGEMRERTELQGCAVARIIADPGVQIEATSACAKCAALATTAVLDRDDAIEEGSLPASPAQNGTRWRNGIGFINPELTPVLVQITVRRGGLDEQASLEVPAGGQRLFPSAPSDTLAFRATHGVLAYRYAINEESGAHVYSSVVAAATRRKRRAVRSGPPPVQRVPHTVTFTPSKDNTLYLDATGSRSNGRGANIFTGTTLGGGIRRAAIAFDVASQIPPGSEITGVTLQLHLSKSIAGEHPSELRAITQDWGEGTSNAGASNDGNGAVSRPGDATWVHASSPDRRWNTPGGDFSPAADATASAVADITFATSAALVARVQSWLNDPAANFGWMVLGNEADATTAKRYASREGSEARRPKLTVEYLALP